jgi:hypothetical protein
MLTETSTWLSDPVHVAPANEPLVSRPMRRSAVTAASAASRSCGERPHLRLVGSLAFVTRGSPQRTTGRFGQSFSVPVRSVRLKKNQRNQSLSNVPAATA